MLKRILVVVVLFIIIAVSGTAFWVYRELHNPIAHTKRGQHIEIPRGSSPTTVINKLHDEGIIKRRWPLAIYLKLTSNGSRLKAGEYDFPSPISPLGAFEKLREGEQRVLRLTVVEGWTRWDIATAMAKIPELKLEDVNSALPLMDNVSLISDLDPKATNLEGYLFPDTYEFPRDAKAADVVGYMVKRFRKEWKPEWTARAGALGLSPREVVTVASLIETEAKLSEERPIIASVIYNRLKKEMALAIDSSVIYASKLAGKWRNDRKVYKSDIDRRSPYNTRLTSGLPPSPIASPGRSSLEAAINPATTDYLYYVREPSRNDGAHNFYSDESGFGNGVRALRLWEQQRDAAAKQ